MMDKDRRCNLHCHDPITPLNPLVNPLLIHLVGFELQEGN
jgi:hypothetical protein